MGAVIGGIVGEFAGVAFNKNAAGVSEWLGWEKLAKWLKVLAVQAVT